MNLKQTIRKVLREELSPRIIRRIPVDEIEKEFIESFNYAYDLTKRRKVFKDSFIEELIYTTVTMMMDSFHWRFVSTLPENEFWYDKIHNELENHYRDRIIKMYKKREGINESILREGSNKDIKSYLLRRVSWDKIFEALNYGIEWAEIYSNRTYTGEINVMDINKYSSMVMGVLMERIYNDLIGDNERGIIYYSAVENYLSKVFSDVIQKSYNKISD